MTRHLLAALLVAAAVEPASALCAPAWSEGRAEGPVVVKPVGPEAAVTAADGQLEGLITDEDGRPLAGVAVTAFGAQLDFAVTDGQGRYAFARLAPGAYVLQAHAAGFEASAKLRIDVKAGRSARSDLRLVRVGTAAARRRVLTASLGAQAGSQEEQPVTSEPETTESHSPTAWRLRHLKRSILRDEQGEATARADAQQPPSSGQDAALSFLEAASAQVQLLTISAFDRPDEIFSGNRAPTGVAFMSLSAPLAHGVWAVQGAMTQGEVASWVAGGRYATQLTAEHATEIGMSYAAQRYDGGNPDALAAMGETSRTVGAMYASDLWAISPSMRLESSAQLEHYGYIERNALFSPSAEWQWEPVAGHTFTAVVAQQMSAPGAQEFVPSPVGGVWMPPERTFSSLQAGTAFRPERSRHVEVGFTREAAALVVGARVFRQQVTDQIVTVFGLQTPNVPRANLGHYFTGSAGSVDAYGWGISLLSPASSRWRGSVSYTLAEANWTGMPAPTYWVLSRSSVRQPSERIHDLTTTVEADIRETSTRLLAVYKLNSSFAGDSPASEPAAAGRFEVQVNQRLPLLLGDAEWEVLVAVKNLFNEERDGASILDELLVVRPPKRFVGGLLIRF